VKPSPGIGLGRPEERSLQFSDVVLPGGPSHDRHSPALPHPATRIDDAAALPSPAVVLSGRLASGTTAASDALPARAHFPGSPVIGRDAPAAFRSTAGPGRASPVPAATV
jgi:hypothetical protein